jgi:hypothetical protein
MYTKSLGWLFYAFFSAPGQILLFSGSLRGVRRRKGGRRQCEHDLADHAHQTRVSRQTSFVTILRQEQGSSYRALVPGPASTVEEQQRRVAVLFENSSIRTRPPKFYDSIVFQREM